MLIDHPRCMAAVPFDIAEILASLEKKPVELKQSDTSKHVQE